MKAVILAAGKGSRLHPLTIDTPKSLIKVAGKTILDHIIENLPDEINEVLIVTKYLEQKIIEHLMETITSYSTKNKILTVSQGEHKGTFGALLTLKDLFSENERFLILNGDDLHTKDELKEFLNHPLAIGVQQKIMPAYYTIETSENGTLVRFREQTDIEKEMGALIATGVYLLDSKVFSFNPIKINNDELGLPQTLVQNSSTYPLYIVETKNWKPINTQTDLEEASKLF